MRWASVGAGFRLVGTADDVSGGAGRGYGAPAGAVVPGWPSRSPTGADAGSVPPCQADRTISSTPYREPPTRGRP
jgi:hypothetical protein